MLSNRSAVRKIEAMSKEEKERYFSTAKRVTVGKYSTVTGRSIKTVYAAKIRGVVVGNKGEWEHETPEAALAYGKKVLAKWRADFLGKK